MIHNVVYYNWLVVYYPIEKWWTSSVGMMTFPINMESHKSPWFQSPPTSHQRCVFVHYQYYQYYQSYCGYLDPAISLLQQSNMMESPYENLHLYIYLGWFSFRKTFINLHYFVAFPMLFPVFFSGFPCDSSVGSVGEAPGLPPSRSACNMQFFPTANGLMLSGSTLMASRKARPCLETHGTFLLAMEV